MPLPTNIKNITAFSLAFILCSTIKVSAQDYKWGSSPQYHTEDSLFIIWEKSLSEGLPKYQHGYIDSSRMQVANKIMDSLMKIKHARHITGHMNLGTKDNAYYQNLNNEYQPQIQEKIDSLRRDSSNVKKKGLILINTDPPKDVNPALDL